MKGTLNRSSSLHAHSESRIQICIVLRYTSLARNRPGLPFLDSSKLQMSIANLKHLAKAYREHLYRRHRQPQNQCIRCSLTFKNPALLEAHSRQENGCILGPKIFQQGISHETEKLLKIRKKDRQDETLANVWMRIYQLLFPNEIAPSPCKSRSSL
jgi:hypothetical protein